jgi:hypothetical protein
MTEPQLPFDPPLPASHPVATTEFARKYNEYCQAALEASPLFAELCRYVRDKQVGETQLLGILKVHLKIPLKSAAEEARRILSFIEGANAEIWQDLSYGKMTVSDARKNSAIKVITESANAPTEATATPPPAGQPDPPAAAAPEEAHAKAKHRNPLFNNHPLSFEEHAARVAAAEARLAAMTPEEREASRAAARKKAGILTPEEEKERCAARAAHEKARIEKLPAEFQARLAAAKARAKKLMAEERARLAAGKSHSK